MDTHFTSKTIHTPTERFLSIRFSSKHNFEKPSDKNALHLMNAAAEAVMKEMPSDLLLMAYGQSDEYSFVVNPLSNAYNRREWLFFKLEI